MSLYVSRQGPLDANQRKTRMWALVFLEIYYGKRKLHNRSSDFTGLAVCRVPFIVFPLSVGAGHSNLRVPSTSKSLPLFLH